MGQLSRRIVLAAVVGVAVVGVPLALIGCGEKTPIQTVSQVQQEYAERFLQGMMLGSGGMVKAEGFDAQAGELVSISVDLGEAGLMHAKRARIVIDTDERTMRLRLTAVTLMPVGGVMETKPEIWTDAIRLSGRVVADGSLGR